MEKARVSIVIPVYNGADYLAQAIDSAAAQSWKNLEVIVVNDGSNDGGATEKVAHSYGNRIRYISKPNGGVASALNVGIQNMTGDYFSWLSHDDLYLPNKVKNQMRFLKKSGDPMQIVAGGYYIVDEARHPLAVMDFNQLYRKDELDKPLFPVFHCAVNGCTLLIHKDHFKRVGMFDERLLTTQDYDMWFRMLRGISLKYVHSIDVISRDHPKQGSKVAKQIHDEECFALWSGMLNSLTDADKARLDENEHDFYSDLYNHFAKYTTYSEVTEFIKTQYHLAEPLNCEKRNRITRWESALNQMRMRMLAEKTKREE